MTTYAIIGMTCGDCRSKVEGALKRHWPLASVTLDPPRANVPGADPVAANGVLAAVGTYRVQPLSTSAPGLRERVAPYAPLILVLGLIGAASFAGSSWMMSFMAGFFIVFGALKLLDLPAFATAYARYDLVAMRVPAWGYAYPFVEIALGFAFLFYIQMGLATWVALILSLIGSVGVIRSVMRRDGVPCVCLGTAVKLPMSKVTIVENLGMGMMAVWMLGMGM